MSTRAGEAQLQELQKALLSLHRAILRHQAQLTEALDEKIYEGYDLLFASIHHDDFAWLRWMSQLLAEIGATLREPDAPLEDLLERSSRLVSEKIAEQRFQLALEKSPHLWMELGALRKVVKV